MRGDKMVLIALEEIKPEQEIFISYGEEYWEARQHLFPTTVKGDQIKGSKALKRSVRFMSETECITFSEDEIVTNLRLNSDTTTEPIAPMNEDIMDPETEKIQKLQRKKERN
jgi:hypothetical protein